MADHQANHSILVGRLLRQVHSALRGSRFQPIKHVLLNHKTAKFLTDSSQLLFALTFAGDTHTSVTPSISGKSGDRSIPLQADPLIPPKRVGDHLTMRNFEFDGARADF